MTFYTRYKRRALSFPGDFGRRDGRSSNIIVNGAFSGEKSCEFTF